MFRKLILSIACLFFATQVAYSDNSALSKNAVKSFQSLCLSTNADYDRIKSTIKTMKLVQLPEQFATSAFGPNTTDAELYVLEKAERPKIVLLGIGKPNICTISVQGIDFSETKKTVIKEFKLKHLFTNQIGLQTHELYVPNGKHGSKEEIETNGIIGFIYSDLRGQINYMPPETAAASFK
jgi:hypothetical protein